MPETPFAEADVLWRWKPEPKTLDHPAKWVDDEADEYAVVRCPEVPCGVMVYGVYRGRWEANPKTRPLIAELLRQLRESQARIEELERSLAGDEAKRIVASWPEWKRNIGHGLEPKPQEEAPQ